MVRLFILSAALGATIAPAAATTGPIAGPSLAQARQIALKVAPGKVVKSDYETEDGFWRYSFDIKQGRAIREIGVDARSGHIVENTLEEPKARD